MKKLIKIMIRLSVILIIVAIIGCATTGKKHIAKIDIPPGLDSTVVVQSFEIANNNFVATDQEQKAIELVKIGKNELDKVDEFWDYLEQKVKQNNSLTNTDKEQFDREYNLGAQFLEQFTGLSEKEKNEKKAKQALGYCLQAQQHLEKAVKINPFDKNARTLLAIIYYNLQYMFGLKNNYEKSIEILERLTRIEQGEHELFRLLGENYLAQKDYEKALFNIQKAQTVYLKTNFESPPDTSILFYYMYAQGDVYARMYDAKNAMKAFQVAKKFARSQQEKTDVKNYLNWINWDGGNIRASELWDKILNLEATKNYEKMLEASEQLLPILKTKKAKFMVSHKVAVIEFEVLDRKVSAVERMRQMYETLAAREFKVNNEDLQAFLDDYGAMLYRLGIEARGNQEKKLALAYFAKATLFEWDQIARAYIELVTLLWNNPKQAIKYGKLALVKNDGLSTEESTELLSLMVRAHKSAGLYDQARVFFNKWKERQE